MLGLIFRNDFHASGGHAVLPDFFGGELPAGDLESLQAPAQMVDGEAGVNQGAESHVAADAGETIEVSKFHECTRNESMVSAVQRRVKRRGNPSLASLTDWCGSLLLRGKACSARSPLQSAAAAGRVGEGGGEFFGGLGWIFLFEEEVA